MAQSNFEVHELDRQDVESYFITGGKVFERYFECPLDHLQPSDGRRLRIFARHIVPLGKEEKVHELPFILFLQGGPGFECRLPASVKSGWYSTAIDEGYQILLLDQRGTGQSSPINSGTLEQHLTTVEKVEYVTHFRADDIVRDCEHIRKVLCRGRNNKASTKISLLGQSFGGFCVVTYLSLFPDSISKALITGGVPPLVESPDAVYMATYQRMITRNKQYYATFPRDILRVRRIIEHLNKTEVGLPDGGRLSPRRFQQLGIQFGYTGGFNTVHQIVFQADKDLERTGKLSTHTLTEIVGMMSFDTNPLYCILQETIYCQNGNASRWSAHRVREKFFAYEFEHDWDKILARKDPSAPVYFTGESVYPWMLDDYAELRKLKEVAIGLAEYTGWGQLYNTKVLESNRTPVAGVTYYNDMFVDFNFSEQTSRSIGGFRQWVTNAYLHNGISASPHVSEYLFQLLRGDITDL
ncbi:proline iminopeptidase [Coemansia reversa NRRL 1564]|uniref:Proline iminopeptidase n=1 Tax=Coemansia reversa (strain ATCC 12441 / NRRL 1564) TaxID=763665 RepID=A0A2G5BC40_COERN|nr:proline iminopeptidase [Coemansia reversa NRRL 1564]|eukprot:PIA16584.1 proline iminopeptidase [Coemansia reversa NRRL 1564]